ncbi:serine/threonine-protein phosphatase 7 long form homolog [Arachis duranensis]|uniref:Serine/threonine-protein phosphatase 7 long form homolog n=1 Tax=Arachis duranensis TaxID=130453 RepID=A0A9C6TP09_ARADU|nr:serine/threonine-protein phosphatase 7 long form homolog [Arachis duranensis]
MLTCNHPVPPDRYNDRVEDHLRITGFYHVSQIGIVQCQKALVNALIERWHPDTHTFHLPIGECAVTLEDVALILGLPTDGLPVTGMTMSSFEALEAECLLQFGVAPRREDCRSSCIKLTWLRNLKENIELTDEINIQRYVRCHIMLLIGTILLGDKSGAGVHWKFLPLLRDFVNIGQYSWGSACLAHLYRALCRASRYNSSVELIENIILGGVTGSFVWVAYAVDRVDPNIIPTEIYMQSVVWSATVPLVSFECIEWHATDRVRRQFGFIQGVPNPEQNLAKAHGEVLTGPKNLNWATAPSHSKWVMHWTNRYHYVLDELPMPSQHPLDSYMNWYRTKYGNRLSLSNVVGEENDEGNQDMDAGNDDMEGGNQDSNEGSQDMDEDNEDQEPQISLPNPPQQEQP